MEITAFLLKNTHHAQWGGFSSKHFMIEIQRWEDSQWGILVDGQLEDSTGKVILTLFQHFKNHRYNLFQQCDVNTEKFNVTHHDSGMRIGRHVKVVIKSGYEGTRGVGLQYFGVEGVPGQSPSEPNLTLLLFNLAKICDNNLPTIGESETISLLHHDYIGQQRLLTCKRGFKFTDEIVMERVTEPEPQVLGKTHFAKVLSIPKQN